MPYNESQRKAHDRLEALGRRISRKSTGGRPTGLQPWEAHIMRTYSHGVKA